MALEQFLVNFVNRTYQSFGNDQIERAGEFIAHKIRWRKAVIALDSLTRQAVAGRELKAEEMNLSLREFAESVA